MPGSSVGFRVSRGKVRAGKDSLGVAGQWAILQSRRFVLGLH